MVKADVHTNNRAGPPYEPRSGEKQSEVPELSYGGCVGTLRRGAQTGDASKSGEKNFRREWGEERWTAMAQGEPGES